MAQQANAQASMQQIMAKDALSFHILSITTRIFYRFISSALCFSCQQSATCSSHYLKPMASCCMHKEDSISMLPSQGVSTQDRFLLPAKEAEPALKGYTLNGIQPKKQVIIDADRSKQTLVWALPDKPGNTGAIVRATRAGKVCCLPLQ